MTPALSNLPTEVITEIASQLDYECEISALSQASRRFYQILTPRLYWFDPNCSHDVGHRPLRGCATYALEWAVAEGREATAQRALAAGAKPNAYLVCCAARDGFENLVRLLYTHSQDMVLGSIPAGLPAHERQEPGCALRGAQARDEVKPWEKTPLSEAASHGQESVVRLLLEYGVDVDGGFKPTPQVQPHGAPLVSAAARGYSSIVRLLVDAGADVGFYNDCLNPAVREGATDVVRLLVEKGADVNYQPSRFETNTPFLNAAYYGHLDIMRYLREHGAGQNNLDYGLKALCASICSNRKEPVEFVTRHFNLTRITTTVRDRTFVACAAAAVGSAELLEEVIVQGWAVQSPPVSGHPGARGATTPLALAAEHGHGEIVQRLLTLGAHPNGGKVYDDNRDEEKSWDDEIIAVPLLEAVRNGHADIVSSLLDHGLEIQRAMFRKEMIRDAVKHERIFRLLFEKRWAADGRLLYDIRQAMKAAIFQKNAAVVQTLIDSGFDFTDLVCRYRDNHLVNLLTCSNKAIFDIFLQNGYAPELGGSRESDMVHRAVDVANIPLLQYLSSHGSRAHLTFAGDQVKLTRGALKAMTIQHSRGDLLDFLLQQGVDIDALDDEGETTLLHLLHHLHSQDTIRTLIERGANPCFRSARGACPLVAAVKEKTCSSCVRSVSIRRGFPLGDTTREPRMLLQAMEAQGIPWEVIEPQLLEAIAVAEQNELTRGALKEMRKWYWRRKYPVLA